ncbi:MAG: hypothetical protein EBR30_00265 [Cytophagia bacterium]|jgi:hypothetical protein|nr:hypothetical protein [Cytophagia bacterium]
MPGTPTVLTPEQREAQKRNNLVERSGAPDLINDEFFNNAGPTYDVKSNFSWTLNENQQIRSWVPGVYLTQYSLTRSGELGSLQNTLLGVAESNVATAFLGGITGQTIGTLVGEAAGIAGGARGGAVRNFTRSREGQAITGIIGATGALLLKSATEESTIYAPYSNLYPAKKTGFEYVLPYLNTENMTEQAGSWRPADEGNFTSAIGKVAGMGLTEIPGIGATGARALTDITGGIYRNLETISKLDIAVLGSAPGVAQEKIKVFAPNEGGDSINLSFYLYNTEKPDDIRNNWEFLFNLTYQNLPNRRSINRLDPPCVYEVVVPGYKRFPVAVIDSLKVTNLGTTRLININTGEIQSNSGASGNSYVKIIPEAYKIDIKITSLLINSRNLYYSAYKSTPVNVNTNPVVLKEG